MTNKPTVPGIERHPDLQRAMEEEITRARNGNKCIKCAYSAITRKYTQRIKERNY